MAEEEGPPSMVNDEVKIPNGFEEESVIN